MENFIIKFKDDLKQQQINRKKLIKEFESQLTKLEEIMLQIHDIEKILEAKEINTDLPILVMLNPELSQILDSVINKKSKKKTRTLAFDALIEKYNFYSHFLEFLKSQYYSMQNIINAFENDKIKDPINQINELIVKLKFTSLNIEEISRIIGMAIVFNSKYAKRNKNHSIDNIDIINQLAEYYNEDGTFKYNNDTETFENLMELLFLESLIEITLYDCMSKFSETKKFQASDLTEILKLSNQKLSNSQIDTQPKNNKETKENYTIPLEVRAALDELRKYYKNGTIVKIPENLEEFYKTLNKTNLDEQEKKYIINLINDALIQQKNSIELKYLSKTDHDIYAKAIKLLDSFNHSNADVYALKQYIEELQTILALLETETNEENKEYLLNEIPNIIGELSLICDKYNQEDIDSENRFIFLLNKDNVPYIYEDIDSLDPIYRKAINSLIPKIDKTNQAQFRKILNQEELAYNMYEVISPRAHVAFVEIDSGIYVIIGANIPRNGYRELNNRLKANQVLLKQMESIVKNPECRNQLLKENEEYLEHFSDSDNKEVNKKVLKAKQ